MGEFLREEVFNSVDSSVSLEHPWESVLRETNIDSEWIALEIVTLWLDSWWKLLLNSKT